MRGNCRRSSIGYYVYDIRCAGQNEDTSLTHLLCHGGPWVDHSTSQLMHTRTRQTEIVRQELLCCVTTTKTSHSLSGRRRTMPRSVMAGR